MKYLLLIIIIFNSCHFTYSQSEFAISLESALKRENESSFKEINLKADNFIEQSDINEIVHKNPKKGIKILNNHVRDNYLKLFSKESTIKDIITFGNYNTLTAGLVYSCYLDKINVPYNIRLHKGRLTMISFPQTFKITLDLGLYSNELMINESVIKPLVTSLIKNNLIPAVIENDDYKNHYLKTMAHTVTLKSSNLLGYFWFVKGLRVFYEKSKIKGLENCLKGKKYANTTEVNTISYALINDYLETNELENEAILELIINLIIPYESKLEYGSAEYLLNILSNTHLNKDSKPSLFKKLSKRIEDRIAYDSSAFQKYLTIKHEALAIYYGLKKEYDSLDVYVNKYLLNDNKNEIIKELKAEVVMHKLESFTELKKVRLHIDYEVKKYGFLLEYQEFKNLHFNSLIISGINYIDKNDISEMNKIVDSLQSIVNKDYVVYTLDLFAELASKGVKYYYDRNQYKNAKHFLFKLQAIAPKNEYLKVLSRQLRN